MIKLVKLEKLLYLQMPNRFTNLFILFLVIVAVIMAYLRFGKPLAKFFPQQSQPSELTQEEVTEALQEYVDQRVLLLEEMTAQQKIAQLMAMPLLIENKNATGSGNSLVDDDLAISEDELLGATVSAQLTQLEPGLITFFGSKINLETAKQYLQSVRNIFQNKKTSPLFVVDHEGGSVQRFSGEGFTVLPSLKESCQLEEQKQLAQYQSSSKELAELGINIVFAPVVDLGGVALKDRSCLDFETTVITARSFISAFGEQQIMPVIKHFPGLGQTTRDLHYSSETVDLAADDTLIFSRLLEAFPNIGVMSSHLQLKDKLDGMPCSLSKDCLYLFEEEFPLVLLFSDALEMKALDTTAAKLAKEFEFLTAELAQTDAGSILTQEARLAVVSYHALMAGNDVLVYGSDVSSEQLMMVNQELAAHYQQDEKFQQAVDGKVMKLLAVKKIDPLRN